MYRIIKLLGLFIAILLVEATIIPSLSSRLRIDFFLGTIMGLVLYVPFAYGIFFVFITSFLFQAFSGSLAGVLPFVYTGSYLGIWLLNDLIYLENPRSQFMIACLFNLLIIAITGLMMNRWFIAEGFRPLLLNTAVTGLVAPPMIIFIRYLWSLHEE